MLRILSKRNLKFGYLPKVISKMRIGGISNRNFRTIITKSIEDYKIIRKHEIGSFLTLFLKNIKKLNQFF